MRYINYLIVVLLVSCQGRVVQEKTNFFDEQLGLTSEDPFLTIDCVFDECGEWGGHEESIKISRKGHVSFKLEYKKYSVNCDSMINVFHEVGFILKPKSKLVMSREIEIKEMEKQAILDFSFDMVRSKFKEEFSGHSGIIISIRTSDSTFQIRTFGGSADHYHNLIDKLNLKK